MACLRVLPDEELRKVLDYAAYTDEPLQRSGDALLAESSATPGWRERALAQLQAAVDRRNPVSTLCYAAIRWMGVPYLKKNAGELQVRMRRQYLRAVAARTVGGLIGALAGALLSITPEDIFGWFHHCGYRYDQA